MPLTNRKTRAPGSWAADEHMRPDTTPEGLAKLPPYFKKDGVVTAGNASGICDGAAALVLAGAALRARRTASSRSDGWWRGAWPAWSPTIMGIGPAPGGAAGARRARA